MIFICSFCGKSFVDIDKLMSSTDEQSRICHDCVDQCYNYINCNKITVEKLIEEDDDSFFVPINLKKHLDKFIVGHESAKKLLSSIFAFHWIRINSNKNLKKHNLLISGPTGSGKTMMVETLAKYFNLPFVTIDATTYTASGYIGEDISSIATQITEAAFGNINKAQKGIVFIDEIDKLATTSGNIGGKDISGAAVQQELLKFIEGKKLTIATDSKLPRFAAPTTTFDTSQLLFIFAGSFKDIQQTYYQLSPGFGLFETKDEQKINNISNALVEYGMLDELVGRIENHIIINELSEKELLEILIGTENPLIKDFESYVNELGITLNITQSALELIVKKTRTFGLGARGLSKQLSELILNNIFEHTSKTNNYATMTIDTNNKNEFNISF